MIDTEMIKRGDAVKKQVHNCSLCKNFTVENRGLCFGCRMGQERKRDFKIDVIVLLNLSCRRISEGTEHGNEGSTHDEQRHAERRTHSA